MSPSPSTLIHLSSDPKVFVSDRNPLEPPTCRSAVLPHSQEPRPSTTTSIPFAESSAAAQRRQRVASDLQQAKVSRRSSRSPKSPSPPLFLSGSDTEGTSLKKKITTFAYTKPTPTGGTEGMRGPSDSRLQCRSISVSDSDDEVVSLSAALDDEEPGSSAKELQRTAREWNKVDERLKEKKKREDPRGTLLAELRSRRRRIAISPSPDPKDSPTTARARQSSVTAIETSDGLTQPITPHSPGFGDNAEMIGDSSPVMSPIIPTKEPTGVQARPSRDYALSPSTEGSPIPHDDKENQEVWEQEGRAASKSNNVSLDDLFNDEDVIPVEAPAASGKGKAMTRLPQPDIEGHPSDDDDFDEYDEAFEGDLAELNFDLDSFSDHHAIGSNGPLMNIDQNTLQLDTAGEAMSQFDLTGVDFGDMDDFDCVTGGNTIIDAPEKTPGKHGVISPIMLIEELPQEYQEFFKEHWRRGADKAESGGGKRKGVVEDEVGTDGSHGRSTTKKTRGSTGKKSYGKRNSWSSRGRGRGRGRGGKRGVRGRR